MSRPAVNDAAVHRMRPKGTEEYEKQLLGDRDFIKKWLSGDYAAKKEMATVKLHLLRPVGKEA